MMMRKDFNETPFGPLGIAAGDMDSWLYNQPLPIIDVADDSFETLDIDVPMFDARTDGVNVRDGLLNLLLTSFQTLSPEVEAILQSIDGTNITQNNFFDRAIDIDAFIRDIELAAQIFNELNARSGDVKTLEAYLAAEDPIYYTQYEANDDALQDRFDRVLNDAQPGLLDYFRSNFTFLWEGVSGFSRAFYEAVATTVGPLGDAAQAMGTEFAKITGSVFGTYAAGIGVAATNTALVTNFVASLVDYLQSTLDNVSLILTADTTNDRIAAAAQIITNLDELVGAWDDIRGLIGGPNANLGQVSAIISLMDSVFDFRQLLVDNTVIAEAATNELLSGLSREFLDDAVVINTVDMGKTVVDMLDAAKDALGIAGPFAGLVEYFVESGSTLADIISIGQSSDWQIRRDTFADYRDLAPIVSDYQLLLNAALERADALYDGDYGADIDPVIVDNNSIGEATLSAKFDLPNEGSSFETGGTLNLNTAYVGEMTPLDKGDYFEITLVAGENYQIKVEEGTHPFAYARLYDASGNIIANPNAFLSDDDTTIISGTALRSGTYYIGVDKKGLSSFFGSYTVSFTSASFISDVAELADAASDISTEYTLLPGESAQSSITILDDDPIEGGDWFEIGMSAGQDYRITLTELNPFFTFLSVYDSSGQKVATSNPALTDNTTAVIEGTASSTGTFYIAVDTGNLTSYQGGYVVDFERVVLPDDVTEFVDARADNLTAYNLKVGETFRGNINRDDDDNDIGNGDWIKVELIAGQDYRIELNEDSLSVGYVRLYDAQGNLVANPDSSLNTNSQSVLEGTILTGGTYFIGVDVNTSTSASGSYTVSLDSVILDADVTEIIDAAADITTQYSLEIGESARGVINQEDGDTLQSNDVQGDWFKVELAAGQNYTISAVGDTLAYLAVKIYDAAGALIVNPNEELSEYGTSVIAGTVLTSGTYFIGVDSGTTLTRTGSYDLSIDAYAPTEDIVELIDAAADPTTIYRLGVGETFRGNMNLSDDDRYDPNGDWIRVTLETGEDYRIVMTEDNLPQGYVRLYDANGNLIASPDTAQATSTQSVIEGTVLTGGTYYIGVDTGSGVHLGDYTVSLESVTLAADITEVIDATADILTAYSLGVGESARGDLNLADNDTRTGDWYRVTLDAGQDYRLTLDAGSARSTEIRLYDANGNILANTNDSLSDDTQSIITGTSLTSGTYFVGVDTGTYTNAGGSYTLSIDAVTLDADVTELSDASADIDTAYTLSVGQMAVGNMNREDGDSGSGDWYRINLVAGEDYRFTMDSTDRRSLDLKLYDADGALVMVENDALSTSYFHSIEGTATTSAVYYLAVETENSHGAYTLNFETVNLPGDYSEFLDAAGDVTTNYSLDVGATVNGSIDSNAGDLSSGDWYAIALEAGETARLMISGERLNFLSIALYDDRGREIFTEDRSLATDDAEFVMGQVATAGTYYVGVAAGTDTTYLLNFDTGLFGTSGDDILLAGAAAEVVRGDLGFDIVDYSASDARVTVNLSSVGTASGGYAQGDSFDEIEGIAGSDFADRLFGDFQDNTLIGNDGNDTLLGRGGVDTLTGGEGADAFRFTNIDGDRVTDFESVDRLVFNQQADIGLPSFIGSLAFSGTAGELRYTRSSAETVFEIDSDGDGNADGRITLEGVNIDLSVQSLTEQVLTLVTAANDDFGNRAQTSTDITLDGTAIAGTLGHIGDADVFSVALSVGETLRVDVSGDIPWDQFMLIDRDGTSSLTPSLTVSDDGNLTIFQTVGISGTYYISIGDNQPSLGDYAISATIADVQIGSDAADTLISGNGADEIYGGAGDDFIQGDNAPPLALDSFEGQVFRAYQAVFDRNPDLAGFNAFTRELRANRLDQESVIADFVRSPEFQATYGPLDDKAFVQQLYLNVLNREGGAEGVAAFTAAIAGGRSRASVVVEFANSPEFVQLMSLPSAAFATNIIIHPAEGQIFRIYQAVFDRSPDLGGFTAFVNSIQAGVLTIEEITSQFVDSPEFQNTYGPLSNAAFVETLYTNVLPGNTDPSGRLAYTAALDNLSLTRAEVVAEFSESEEFRIQQQVDADVFVAAIFTEDGDILTGGTGADILFGGRGADVFQYDASKDGADIILDFTVGVDRISVNGDNVFDSFAAIIAVGQQISSDVVFDFGNGNIVSLIGVQLTDLSASDFVVTPSAQTSITVNELVDAMPILDIDASIDGFF